jgi:uncharacterized Tic20 family protein
MPGETAGTGPGQPPAGGGFSVPTSGAGGYTPPPTSGGGYTPPPTSGGGYTPPPTSGATGYGPSSGAGYTPQPSSGAGGYAPPPASGPGGYPPGGYGAPQAYPGAGYGQPPAGYANDDEKTWSLIAHWGGVAGIVLLGGLAGWVGPLIAYTSKGKESPTVRAHSLMALNFHLTWAGANLLAWIVAFVTCLVATPLVAITVIVALVIGIIGSIKATNGEFWRYPATIELIK